MMCTFTAAVYNSHPCENTVLLPIQPVREKMSFKQQSYEMFYMIVLLQPEKQTIMLIYHSTDLTCILNKFYFNIGEKTLAKQTKKIST